MATFTTFKKSPGESNEPVPSSTSSSSPSETPDLTSSFPKLRILVLHGGSHNSKIFQTQVTPLLNFFKNQTLLQVEFVFLNSPLLTDPSSTKTSPNYKLRHWYDETSSNCLGIDASLLWLIQSLELEMNSNPFHGILGFSQGATVAALLPLLAKKSPIFSTLKFLILANGYPIVDKDKQIKGLLTLDSTAHTNENVVDIPTLHIIGETNNVVRPEESMALLSRFIKPQLHLHPHGHLVPQSKLDFEVIGRFLLGRAQELKLQLGNYEQIEKAQGRLLLLEIEARKMVRESTMEVGIDGKPPPRALMAVIDRGDIGAWSGTRKETPLRGAPCPTDFVKQKSDRNREPTKKNGEVEGGDMGRSKPPSK
ncbi:hypothetical protein ScalyP_jg3442 [Parmales sp. scaly parma]|nr:hypothetical protein ScalyP_jg3442 [Parmales sp. scaly parma]